jgi:hypothetical protein
MTFEEFENKYHRKIVKPIGKLYNIPNKEYVVTAALYNYYNETIFAIRALDYTIENKQWITFRFDNNKIKECMSDFEIVRDATEEEFKILK